MKLIFMGTSQFAVPTLNRLLENRQHEIIAVYTRAPKPAGRGNNLSLSPIHQIALEHNLPIFTPATLNNKESQQEFIKLNADIAIVVSYGLILPEEIIKSPKYQCLNLHPSQLPRWRGASPMQRTIINGDNQTAVMVIKMAKELDSGEIVNSYHLPLEGNETYQNLSEKLSEIGAELMLSTINNLETRVENNFYHLAIKQNDTMAKYAHKIEKSETKINWEEEAQIIENKIRGLNGYIESYFTIDNEKIKVFSAEIIKNIDLEKYKSTPYGSIIDSQLTIFCKNGAIRPLILQKSGKKILTIKEFLLGFKPTIGKILN